MNGPSLLAVAGVGLVLGLRHAFEPDHLAAVSTLATRQARVWPAALLGIAWGTGHTVSVAGVALGVVGLGVALPAGLWPLAELAVGVLLVTLGGTVVWRYAIGRWHIHRHVHGAAPHLHLHSHARSPAHEHAHASGDMRRSLGFGLLHGIAGSGVVVALLVAATPHAAMRAIYVAAFGMGTIMGMVVVSLALGAMVRFASGQGARWAERLHLGAATASLVAGILLAGDVIAG